MSSSPLNGLPSGHHSPTALVNGTNHLVNGFNNSNPSNYPNMNGINGNHEQILDDDEVRHGFGSISTLLSEEEQKAGHFLYWTEVSR